MPSPESKQWIAPSVQVRRYTPEMTHLLVRIASALARIDAAPVWPAAVDVLRFSAQAGTVHYSTLIEGNHLSRVHAARAARGELAPTTRAEVELVNYVNALRMIDDRIASDDAQLTEDFVLALHREATKGLGRNDAMFKPRHVGAWRDGAALVTDPISGQVLHQGPPPEEVGPRMAGLLEWVDGVLQRPVEWPLPVVGAVLHYSLTDVHPFADGNGRVARLLTTALLAAGGHLPGRMFNLDAHYGRDKEAYLAALRSVKASTFSQSEWVTYFLAGAAEEYERVATEIDQMAAIGARRLQLTDTQQRALATLMSEGRLQFDRQEYAQAGGVSRSTASRDVRTLMDHDVLAPVGSGRDQRFRLASVEPVNPWRAPSVGRPRAWTEERIERELRALIGDRAVFPSVEDFDAAGLRPLYNAIHRTGGSPRWATRVGVAPPRRGRRPGS